MYPPGVSQRETTYATPVHRETRTNRDANTVNIQIFFATQPPSVQNIVGTAITDYSERDIAQFASLLSSTDEIAIFGDGSVKDGRGSHATRVYADNEYTDKSPALESAAITSGDPDTITSLRSETSSLLSGLYILNLLSTFYSTTIDVTVHFYYDNCESLRRVDTLDEFEYFADPLATDFDIWAEIKRVSGMMPIKTETTMSKHIKTDTNNIMISLVTRR